ncbi:response regulator [Haliangium ochraceum]|uniref:Response regulator receiver protein n=1 Tax=Haliangium ochraceum (strain DSM 14365 / JCM 11303 / SMP-2) TaxID=502025 RepID=D0LYR5_HALO1|nr:response regulator [Haliangium ochraceum]ACY17931.1 response regulator receiver protein [Haliangium ochraceum DSM 14365]
MASDSEAKPRILIVDDEMLNRELLRRVLHRSYEIEEAGDASQAVSVLEACGDQVNLILCDQLMPGRSGTELAAIVRERWPHINFLLLTGYDDDPSVLESVENGHIAEVVPKPWRGALLKKRIIRLLEGEE